MLCLIPVPWELASSDDTCLIQSLPDWWQNADFPTSALSLCLKVSPQHSTVSESPPFSPFLYQFLAQTQGFQFLVVYISLLI